MNRAMAKIKINGTEQTISGGLKEWEGENLLFILGDGSELPVNKDDVEALQITDKLFYLDGQEPEVQEVEEIIDEKKPFVIQPAGYKNKKTNGISFKLQQCVDIVKANPNATRKETIALIVKHVGMSEAGASTYHQMAKKHLGL